MYVNCMGLRAIERVSGISHNSVMNWVKQTAETLPDAPESPEIPEIAEANELPIFDGRRKIGV